MRAWMVLAAASLAAASCGTPWLSLPDPLEVRISADQAADAVRAFIPGATDVRVDGPVDGPFHRRYTVEGPDFIGFVDAFDGRVVLLAWPDVDPCALPGPITVAVTLEDALARAQAFLEIHGVPTTGRVAARRPSAPDCAGYEVTWFGYAGEVRLPDRRLVGINPSNGNVFGYQDDRRSYASPLQAAIGRDEAIRLASEETSLPAPAVERVELAISFDQSGAQLLVWEVALGSGESHLIFHVDATMAP